MRPVLLLALLLAACGAEPLTVRIPKLPDATHLEMGESPPLRRYQYQLEVTSHLRQQAELVARLEDPAPEGVIARIAGRSSIPREGTDWPWLILIVPEKPGPFQGAVSITSPQAPDWSVRYTFSGTVVAGPTEGKRLNPRPAGVALGSMKPGEQRTFAVALENIGSEDVTISEWAATDESRVLLARLPGPVIVKSGGEYQMLGAVVAPDAAGPFEAVVRIRTDAENHKDGIVGVRFGGTVVPDYAPTPPRAIETAAYPSAEPEFKVKIIAREGVPPFTVASVSGYEPYLDIVSTGTKEPAREQLVQMKLRRDAPTDASRPAEWRVRFKLSPGDVEVTWPLSLVLYPPIHAQPREIQFGRIAEGTEKQAEILLTSVLGRTFHVTGAHAENRRVRVTLPEHAPGTVWRVLVSLPRELGKGAASDRVVIETDDPDVPKLIVPVKAEIR